MTVNPPFISSLAVTNFPALAKIKYGKTTGHTHFYLAAAEIIEHFLGSEWTNKQLLPGKGDRYLNPSLISDEDANLHFYRVINLAEHLINLQGVVNFASIIDCIRPRRDFESSMAELEVAQVLARQGLAFEFVKPSGVAGQDYDFQIDFEGYSVCADVKCKIDSTKFSVKSIINSIKKARAKNLPKHQPGMVFIKAPDKWFEQTNFTLMSQAESGISTYLESTETVVGVCLYAHKFIYASDASGGFMTWTTVLNKNSRLFDIRLELLDKLDASSAWISLYRVWGLAAPHRDRQIAQLIAKGRTEARSGHN